MEHRRISIGPRDVLRLRKPTNGFLCNLSANEHNLEFLLFTIRDDETKQTLFQVGERVPMIGKMEIDDGNFEEDDCLRAIKYTFCEDVLRLPVVSTSLTFKVGKKPLRGLRMIERHYFRNQLVKSFDFSFGFCIPESTNVFESIYEMPPMGEEMIQDMIAHPGETTSDSFYFIGNELIMHNKARYSYVPAQNKRNEIESVQREILSLEE